ncbi:helix-turn-helix domain-containing protein [Marinimicrobium koreense]|uniref:helix-turn-helix domain-containing protein n=1 Tax=Marinimicrobium koreense TaxID=306545 RepID=UPI003F70C9A8
MTEAVDGPLKNLTHDALLFNIHDLVLLMSASQYLLLAALLFFTRRPAIRSTYLLVGLLLASAVRYLDTLLIWSDPLRQLILEWNPNLLLLGSFSYWLIGPLLYAYVLSVLYRQTRFRWYHGLHLLPAVLATLMMLSQYHWRPAAEQVALMRELDFIWSSLMSHTVTLWHLSVIGYGGYCLLLLWHYRRQLQERYANVEVSERRWLAWIILGFVLIASWQLGVHLTAEYMPAHLANLTGVASNYLNFVFVNSLVFISIRYTHLFSGLPERAPGTDAEPYKPEQVRRVEALMTERRPYLDSTVSLESLARQLSLPERTLSRILNQHFGKNFFEFINGYRVERAKQLLIDPDHSARTILEIMADAGFTSKSTFNAIFKKHVGQTPSQYRKRSLEAG